MNRSSTSRTGTGATSPASAAAKPRASAADWPSAPDRPRGRPDDHLDDLVLRGQAGQLGQVAPAAPHRRQRAGQQAGRVAAGHADPGQADVNGQPDTGPHQEAPRWACLIKAGLIQDTNWLRHGLTVRHR